MILDPDRTGGSDSGPGAIDENVSPGGRYRHPLGWYSISIPPGWKAVVNGEPLRILAAREEAAAVVTVTKATDGSVPGASLADITKDVPGLTVIERRNAAEGEQRGMRFARVEEIVGSRSPRWAFWRRPRPEAHLFAACFTRGPLVAFVTFEVDPGRVERHRLAAGALIGSFELAEHPLPSADEFVARFVRLARHRIPRRNVQPVGPLTVAVDGSPFALDQHYRALACEPAIGDTVFERIFAFLAGGEPPRTDSTFEEVRTRILLTIKPREWVEAADRNVPEHARAARLDFLHGTALVFVIDHPHLMRFVTVKECERWEVPPREMLRVARENLRSLKPELAERLVVDSDGRLCAVALAEGDGYDAARIVLPGLHDQIAQRLGPNFAVAIPNRDFLIAFMADDPKVVSAIRKRASDDVRRRPYPITEGFFRLAPDGSIGPLRAQVPCRGYHIVLSCKQDGAAMVRTQIQLSEEQYRRLKALAAQRSVSIAELVRQGVDRVLNEVDRQLKWASAWKAVGSCHDPQGAADVGTDHDAHLAEIWARDHGLR